MHTVQRTCKACAQPFAAARLGRPPLYCSERCKAATNHALNQAKPCDVDGCDQRRYQGRAVCSTHAMRRHRYSDDEGRDRTGNPWFNSHGYIKVGRPGHPLADKQGSLYEHRLVLFEHIGPGVHQCHWCGIDVEWMVDLEADHVNFDRVDNRSANLVPSCHGCNTRRAIDRRWDRPGRKALTCTDVLES